MYCWERNKALHALIFIGVNYVLNCLEFQTFIERYVSVSVTEWVVPETGLRHIRLNYVETFTLKNVKLFCERYVAGQCQSIINTHGCPGSNVQTASCTQQCRNGGTLGATSCRCPAGLRNNCCQTSKGLLTPSESGR